MNRRTVLCWGGLAALLLLVGLASGGRTQSGSPLDPRSTDPLGTRALVLFLEEFGAEVTIGLPTADTRRALVLADQLSPEQRADLEAWVEDGGTLVVTDPGSPFSPQGFPAVDSSGSLTSGTCTIEELQGLRLAAGSFVLYPSTNNGERCFGDEMESYVQVNNLGQGRIVVLGGASALTNENLAAVDNAVLAARLLLADESTTGNSESNQVAVLYENVLTPGSRSLGDLIPTGAKWATWQLLVAFVLYVLWKAPRFGRPVTEPQAVELPGSLLVRATAELHRRSGGYAQASQGLRLHLDRRLRKQLRASPELPGSELIELAAAGHDLDGNIIGRATAGPPATTGQELADLVAEIDQVNDVILTQADPVPSPVGDTP